MWKLSCFLDLIAILFWAKTLNNIIKRAIFITLLSAEFYNYFKALIPSGLQIVIVILMPNEVSSPNNSIEKYN